MPLWTGYFLPGHPGGVTQAGAFDAFRVVALTRTRDHHSGYPPFGSLSIDTDAVAMPPGFASDLQGLAGLGDALTASFRPQAFRARRLKTGYANLVVIDFDMSNLLPAQTPGDRFWTERPKLLDNLMPNKAELRLAAQRICNILDTVECGNVVSFKLEKTGDVVTHNLNLPDVDVKGLNDGEASKARTMENGEEHTMLYGRLGAKAFPGLVSVLGLLVLALLCVVLGLRQRRQRTAAVAGFADVAGVAGFAGLGFADVANVAGFDELEKSPQRAAADEEKPGVGRVVDDDTASTATPVSLANTAAFSEDLPVDQV
jgi:hypothetical protein